MTDRSEFDAREAARALVAKAWTGIRSRDAEQAHAEAALESAHAAGRAEGLTEAAAMTSRRYEDHHGKDGCIACSVLHSLEDQIRALVPR